jgi:hypothetical protein
MNKFPSTASIFSGVANDTVNNLLQIINKYKSVPSTASIATNLGKLAYNDLSKMQSLMAALTDYGVKKAKGEETTLKKVLTDKPNFMEVPDNIPGTFNVGDIVKSVPGITGKYTPTDEQSAKIQALWDKFKASGLDAALNPLIRTALRSGEQIIPTGVIQSGLSEAGRMVAKSTPLLRMGSFLAKQTGIKPTIDVDKTNSLMDIAKPVVGFGLDTATHPITAVSGSGTLMLKGIKNLAQGLSLTGKGISNPLAVASAAKMGKETFEAFGEAYPRIFQMIGEAVGHKDPEKIYNFFRSPSKIVSQKVQDAIMKSQRDIGLFNNKAKARTEAWASIPDEAARKAVGEALMNNNYSLLEPFKVKFPEIESVAKNIRRLITEAGLQGVKGRVLDYNTFVANKDTYVRRMYEYFENPENFVKANNPEANLANVLTESPISGTAGNKINTKIMSQRVADEATRKRLGVLGPEQIGYTSGEGSVRTFKSARNSEMFNEISASPDIVKTNLPESIVNQYPGSNLAEKELNAIKQSEKTKINIFNALPKFNIDGETWVKMPTNKGYGALADKYIRRVDADHIIGTYALKGAAMKTYEKLLSLWKSGKVLWSPPAQSRNLLSNTILMTYSGIPFTDAVNYLYKASKAVITKGSNDYVNRAFIKFGGQGTAWADNEAFKLGSKFTGQKISKPSLLKDVAAIPGNVYAGTENIFKNAIMRYWHEEKGLSLKEAFNKAQETLFNYGDTSKAINLTKKTLIPFFTFSSKALPFTAKSALSRPNSVLPLMAAKDVINDYNAKKIGITADSRAILNDRYGQWYLITGGTKLKPEIIDLSYIIPGLTDLSGNQGSKGILGNLPIPQSFQFNNPAFAILEAAPGINKSFYFQKPITSSTDIKMQEIQPMIDSLVKSGVPIKEAYKKVLGNSAILKRLAHVYKSWAPANPLVPGTYQNEQLTAAIKGMPTSMSGEVPTLKTAITSLTGIKNTPVDILKQTKINMGEFQKSVKDIRNKNILINKSKLSNEEKKMQRMLLSLKLKQILKEQKERRK